MSNQENDSKTDFVAGTGMHLTVSLYASFYQAFQYYSKYVHTTPRFNN
jgi:hypothetical protein